MSPTDAAVTILAAPSSGTTRDRGIIGFVRATVHRPFATFIPADRLRSIRAGSASASGNGGVGFGEVGRNIGEPAARPVGCDPRWGARAARASGRGLVYTMQVISHKSWGGYPGGRMLKILFRGAGRSGRDGSIVVAGVG